MTPGIASLNPGLMSTQPSGLLACTPEACKDISPGERSVASHRGLVNPGETHAGGVRGEIGGSAKLIQDELMRAMIYRAYGGPERLELTDIPRPSPGPGQVLVRVIASSVNPIDWKLASGVMRLIMPLKFPVVPGFDVAGNIAELGPGVTGYAIGDRVHARIARKGWTGACADFAVVGSDVLAKVPAGMDPGEAAALPLAGLTALQGLRDRAGLPLEGARERVLVVGASGGVGHISVQIARAAGATVVGVCSERNATLVSSLGAHDVIDYKKPDPYRGQAPFDIVLDCVGGSPFPWIALLASGEDMPLPCPAPACSCEACSTRSLTRRCAP